MRGNCSKIKYRDIKQASWIFSSAQEPSGLACGPSSSPVSLYRHPSPHPQLITLTTLINSHRFGLKGYLIHPHICSSQHWFDLRFGLRAFLFLERVKQLGCHSVGTCLEISNSNWKENYIKPRKMSLGVFLGSLHWFTSNHSHQNTST